MKKEKIGAEQCYLALVLIEEAISNGIIFSTNRKLKEWLVEKILLVNDEKKIGIKATKRIFWLLSATNGFIARSGKRVVITEDGYRFFRADEFKRFEMFSDKFKEFRSDIKKNLRYIKNFPAEIVGKGYRLVRCKGNNKNREFTKAGWIAEFAHFDFGNKIDSASIAFYHAECAGDWHEHSRTDEIFLFTAGNGYVEIGEEKKRVYVNSDWALIIDAGISHRVVPIWVKNGNFLSGFVISFPGWKSKNEYKIGESSRGRHDGPVE